MNDQEQSLATLQDIKRVMERSGRFISLSGLSGISAGICALIGAWLAWDYVYGHKDYLINRSAAIALAMAEDYRIIVYTWLFWIALGTLVAALTSAFIFTWIKAKKQGMPIWGHTAKRLMLNISIPLIAGGIFLFKLSQAGTFGLIAPGCLIFYGLGLLNASKYTLGEIRWLGIAEIVLGIINLWFVGAGLYFWAMGFGVLHIVYGSYMWWKYERSTAEQ
ncbi:MAG TPA: hypothetical protein PKC62_12835 [Ferruginibacter sp.]|nr:hypothetical protein [Chitinophagaceae bacterium]HMT97567.1 hypothetical protein [Ferruginibacter sp.]HMU24559.1 hypothetical protein [Ferruginibacter sp.]